MKVLYICAAALLLSGGCEFSCNAGGLSAKKLQKEIEKSLLEQGITAKAACPKIEKNATTTCTAETVDGKTIIVEVVAEKETANFNTKNLAVGKKIEAMITDQYKANHEIVITDVSCPDVMLAGEAPTCKGRAEDVDVGFNVSIVESRINADPGSGFMFGHKLEALIEKNSKVPIKVDCGAKLRVSKPGARFTCTLQEPSGDKQLLHVKIKNSEGNVSTGMTPPE